MPDLINALILGVVEGLTEFLPISSTGHLILAADLLGATDERWKVFNIVIQAGAMLAVLWEYRARFFRVDLALYRNLVVAFIPAAVLGLAFSKYIKAYLFHAEPVALAGTLCAPAGSAQIAMIDPRDVGTAAAAVLTSAGHDGRSYALTGPEAVTYAQVAEALADATGRDVEFVDLPDEAAVHGLTQAGLPLFAAEQVVAIFAQARLGMASQVTTTVEALTGRPPRDISSFARDSANVFSRREAA